jgi:hypothetical protein
MLLGVPAAKCRVGDGASDCLEYPRPVPILDETWRADGFVTMTVMVLSLTIGTVRGKVRNTSGGNVVGGATKHMQRRRGHRGWHCQLSARCTVHTCTDAPRFALAPEYPGSAASKRAAAAYERMSPAQGSAPRRPRFRMG